MGGGMGAMQRIATSIEILPARIGNYRFAGIRLSLESGRTCRSGHGGSLPGRTSLRRCLDLLTRPQTAPWFCWSTDWVMGWQAAEAAEEAVAVF